MTTTYWNPLAQLTAQVVTLTVTAVANSGTLTATLNGKSITYTCTGTDTTSTAAAAWQALLAAASTPAEFGEITWTVSGAIVTATAKVPGTPFYASGWGLTKSQAGGSTCTLTQTQANSSPSDAFNALNWIRNGASALPQNGDDLVVKDSSVPILWNVDQLAAVLLNSYTRYQSFTGSIGLPTLNTLGYIEYRPTYFQLGSNVAALPIVLGIGTTGTGPTRERYNVNAYRTSVNVVASGSATDNYAVLFLGSHAANTLRVVATSVGVALGAAGETAALQTAQVDGGGTLDFGSGVSFTGTGGAGTLTVTAGTSDLFCACTSIIAQNSAVVNLSGTNATYASVTCTNGVSLTLLQPMTISALTLAKSSTLDNSSNLGAVTVTQCTMDGDTCQVNDPNNTIAFTGRVNVLGQVTSGPFVRTGPMTMP